jgi:hypothetical protein
MNGTGGGLKTRMGSFKGYSCFPEQGKAKTNDSAVKTSLSANSENLNIFAYAFRNEVSADVIIDLLSNDAYKEALKTMSFLKKLKAGNIEPYIIFDERTAVPGMECRKNY